MLLKQSKTRTGWKFTFACVTENNNVCALDILCTRRPDYEEAKNAAIAHIHKTFLSFIRFANNEEAEFLGTSFLKNLDDLYKFYVDFSTSRNSENNSQPGRKFYSKLPNGTYFAMGVNGSKAGDAFLFCFDHGTCLIPIYHAQGKQVCIPETNYGLELHSQYDNPAVVGFTSIKKIVKEWN